MEERKWAIALDSYDEIFSDFDVSPYSVRELSEDVIKEIKRRYDEIKRSGKIVFSLPREIRDEKIEAIIKKRIRGYFREREKEIRYEIKKTKRAGIFRAGVGIILIILSTISPFYFSGILLEILSTALQAMGWVYLFYGADDIFRAEKKKKETLSLFSVLAKAKVQFVNEEDITKYNGQRIPG